MILVRIPNTGERDEKKSNHHGSLRIIKIPIPTSHTKKCYRQTPTKFLRQIYVNVLVHIQTYGYMRTYVPSVKYRNSSGNRDPKFGVAPINTPPGAFY